MSGRDLRVTCSIRPASEADVGRLALVGGATFLETFAGVLDGAAIVGHCEREHSQSAYRRYLQGGAQAFLAELAPGAAPVGFSLLDRPSLPGAASDGSDVELKRIYALSRFHGQGVGAALMDRALDQARGQGAERLLLGVYAGNMRARAFYAKNGFVQIADRKFRVGGRDYGDVVLARAIEQR